MDEILIFVYIILGISHLILFLKVWIMTDNIKKIKEHLIPGSYDSYRTEGNSSAIFVVVIGIMIVTTIIIAAIAFST